MVSLLNVFLAGATSAGILVVGLFFLRFWARTREALFLAFGASFFLLAANQAVLTLFDVPPEYRSRAYVLRLAAFAILILAIVRKNLRRGS